jgi:hypothetical protein
MDYQKAGRKVVTVKPPLIFGYTATAKGVSFEPL